MRQLVSGTRIARTLAAILVMAWCIPVADAALLCVGKTRAVKVRDACRKKERPLDLAEIGIDEPGQVVAYQPFWSWWWWGLPWRLGYRYQRVLTVSSGSNLDCRGALYDVLEQDVNGLIADPTERTLTLEALGRGRLLGGSTRPQREDAPALAVLIGSCLPLDQTHLGLDYEIVSTKGSTDTDPRLGPTTAPSYPWTPGRCLDFNLDVPASASVDRDAAIRAAHRPQWLAAGAEQSTVDAAMLYFLTPSCAGL